MTTKENLKKYHDWIFKCSAYQMALNIIGIDKQTVAPSAGASYRDERSAYLAGELFSLETDPETVKLLKELKDDPEVDAEDKRAIELYYKRAMDTLCIPKDEYVEFKKLCDESFDAWILAKSKADYSIFEPYLKKVIESQKKLYGYRDSDKSIYNQMLDDYEPGMNVEKYDEFFEALKERLVPLIKKVTASKQINEDFLHQSFPVEEQKKFMDELLKYLHFDPSWGYQNESEHPFTSWTCENDCRTTTKYIEDNVASAILSTVHEVGHAYYEHNINPKYDGMILSEGVSSGMHESQSRLCENYLGKTLAFWKYHYPKLQKVFPKQLEKVSLEDFYKAINASKPSFVRTEADELTYPLHVLIRYEIEKGLFDGSISTEGLDKTWNAKYKEYLGIDVPNDKLGILQDVHWSDGSFGYFPTYALGTAFAAQYVHAMKKDLDVDSLLENNKFDEVMNWLKENIHTYGFRYEAPKLMKMVTGEEFNVNYFLDYIEDKYTKLYQL